MPASALLPGRPTQGRSHCRESRQLRAPTKSPHSPRQQSRPRTEIARKWAEAREPAKQIRWSRLRYAVSKQGVLPKPRRTPDSKAAPQSPYAPSSPPASATGWPLRAPASPSQTAAPAAPSSTPPAPSRAQNRASSSAVENVLLFSTDAHSHLPRPPAIPETAEPRDRPLEE